MCIIDPVFFILHVSLFGFSPLMANATTGVQKIINFQELLLNSGGAIAVATGMTSSGMISFVRHSTRTFYNGATCQIRTDDRPFTKRLLYQLS